MREFRDLAFIFVALFFAVGAVLGGATWYGASYPAAIVTALPEPVAPQTIPVPGDTPTVEEEAPPVVIGKDDDSVSIPPASTEKLPARTTPKETLRHVAEGLDEEEREDILRAHNVARRDEGIDGLTWSDTLTLTAQSFADDLARRGCILEHSGGPFGENIYYSRKFGTRQTPRTVTEVMSSFTDEKKFYNEETGGCKAGEICGHYTQIMWAGTTEVGCGRSLCLSDEREELWVCHYDPPGNVEGLLAY